MRRNLFLFSVVFFISIATTAQNDPTTNIRIFKSFLNERKFENLNARVSHLLRYPNDSILNICVHHLDNMLEQYSNQCDKVYLTYTKANILRTQQKFGMAIVAYKKVEQELRNARCPNLKLQEFYNSLGASYNYVGQNTKALDNYFKAISQSKKNKDTLFTVISLHNVGNLYFTLKKSETAKKYYKQSLELCEKNESYKTNKASAYEGLGNLYLETQPDADSAIIYFNNALKIYKQKAETFSEYRVLNNLGIAYELKGDYKKALFLYNSVYEYASQGGFRETMANVCFDLGNLYSSMNLLDNAVAYTKKAYKNYQAIGMVDGMVDASELLSNLYKKQNKFEEAYQQISVFNTFKDSLSNASNIEQLTEMKKDFEFNIEREHLNNEVLSYKLRNTLLVASIIGLLFISILIFFYRKRKSALAEVQRQEQFTFQLLQNTEEERSRIANELHDSVNHELLHLKNSLINGKTIAPEDVANVIEEVRVISRNLNPSVLQTIGLEGSIEYLCERLTELGLFTTCEIDYVKKLSPNKELQLYRNR